MARTAASNKPGSGYKHVICCRCGAHTIRRKTLAVVEKGRDGIRAAYPRVCRDKEACEHRRVTKDNENVLAQQDGEEENAS